MKLEEIYYQGYLIRIVEEKILDLFSGGRVQGTTHTCIGQELNAVLVCSLLAKNDIVVSNHRGHGHYIAKTGDTYGLVAEIMGRGDGVCGGRGGSQHLHNPEYNFYSNGVLGNMLPVAAGMAFAEKEKKSGNIVVCFLGDGALGEGVLYETLNLASVFSLPILFVLEHNQYAQSTRTENVFRGNVQEITNGFRLGHVYIDRRRSPGKILDSVQHSVYEAESFAPSLIEIESYRLSPHSKGDDYRDEEEIERHRKTDPLTLLREEVDNAKKLEEEAHDYLRESLKPLLT